MNESRKDRKDKGVDASGMSWALRELGIPMLWEGMCFDSSIMFYLVCTCASYTHTRTYLSLPIDNLYLYYIYMYVYVYKYIDT